METENGIHRNLWIHDFERGTRTRFTFEGNQWASCWTRDGQRLTFNSVEGGLSLYWQTLGESNAPEMLLSPEHAGEPGSWSSDDRVLTFRNNHGSGGKADIWLMPREGDREPFAFIDTPFNEHSPAFSPQGGLLAYVSDESEQWEVYIRPYPGSGGRTLVSIGGGRGPVWSADGRELFYRRGDELRVVDIELDPELRTSPPRTLFAGPFAVGYDTLPAFYDVSPDGERFVMVKRDDETVQPSEVIVVLNWFEELKRLVPTDNRR
jgi:Tol biopolymer transport system component